MQSFTIHLDALLSFLFVSFICLSCASKEISVDTHGQAVPMPAEPYGISVGTNDEPIAGKDLTIQVRLPQLSNMTSALFLQAYSYTSDNSLPVVSVHELVTVGSGVRSSATVKTECQSLLIPVPSNAAWMNLSIVGYDGEYSEFQTLSLPVVGRDALPVRNALLFALSSLRENETSHAYFYTERQLYPDNPVAFIVQWKRLTGQGGVHPEELKRDIKMLESMPESSEKDVALYIAHSMLDDSSALPYLGSLLKLRNDPVFNHPLITGALNDALESASLPDRKQQNIVEDLCVNNPLSLYTFYRISGMEWKYWSPQTILSIAEKRLEKQEEPQVLYVLLQTCMRDSGLGRVFDVAERLVVALDTKHPRVFLSDPFRNSALARTKYLLGVAEAYEYSGHQEKAHGILSELSKLVDSRSPNHALVYKLMGRILAQGRKYEASLAAFQTAYRSAGLIQVIRDSIVSDVLAVIKDPERVNQLLEQGESPRVVLPAIGDDAPEVHINDGPLSIASLEGDVILEFSSSHCELCNVNLQNLARRKSEGKLEDAEVIVISGDGGEDIQSVMESLGVSFHIARNGDVISDYFGVRSTPVTIRISAGGRLLYRVVGGGGPDFSF